MLTWLDDVCNWMRYLALRFVDGLDYFARRIPNRKPRLSDWLLVVAILLPLVFIAFLMIIPVFWSRLRKLPPLEIEVVMSERGRLMTRRRERAREMTVLEQKERIVWHIDGF